jgi:DNA polymerase elongation subunit (family B)
VEEKGGGVIYGDTDSVLVSRECLEEEVEGIGEDIVKTVNGKYRVLRLVLERVYVRLLL